MNSVKSNPKGVDWYIQKLQNKVYEQLISKWQLNEDLYLSYGRCYKTETDDGVVPKAYIGNGEYKDVFFDDTVAIVSFFDTNEEYEAAQKTASVEVGVNMYFLCSLPKISSFISDVERFDQECFLDVLALIKQVSPFNFIKADMTIDKAIKPTYNGYLVSKGLKNRDLQPFFCFRIEMNVIFNPILLNC